ncbi:MAG: Chitinase [Thermoplasmatales archaeon]|nr:Chitinase [Thermoplasmatales archaeon]
MKISHPVFIRQLFVLAVVFFGLLCCPAFMAQNASLFTNVGGYVRGSSPGTSTPVVYDLLIIAPRKFVNELQPLVTHKNRVGVKTNLVTLSEVYHQMFWYGRDPQEKIKYFIKTAKETWGITYVMLVGDFETIPIRYVYNADNNSGWDEPCFISELYYADLYDRDHNFSSWDSSNNGVYGEWYGATARDRDIDLYPDVYVGRLACVNDAEVRVMVRKIITYETTAFGQEWFHRFVVVAGDTYPESLNPNWTGNEGEENTQDAIDNMSGFEPVKLWTSDESFTGPRDVIRAINGGCGFLMFEGHANAFSWSTHPTNEPQTWINGLNTVSMDLLRNKRMLPVCIVGGCHNNEFDVTPKNILWGVKEQGLRYFSSRTSPSGLFWHYTWIRECWGWKLTRMNNGGSIATIGCTGLGMSKEDKQSFSGAGDFLEPTFFYEYGVNGTTILGNAWGNAITNYLNRYPIDWDTPAAWDSAIDAKTVQQWALFGDPSLKIGGYPQAGGSVI